MPAPARTLSEGGRRAAARARRLGRRAKIALALGLTALGVVAAAALAFEQRSRRDTDLFDASSRITRSEREARADGAPELRFRDVAQELGIDFVHGPGERGRTLPEDTGSGLAWGDVDGDGDADLYLANFPGPWRAARDTGATGALYRNEGLRFADATSEAGLANRAGIGMGASFADCDGDGAVDLYVTNAGPNRLYRNRPGGAFTDVSAQAGVDDPSWSTGISWGDFDRDGWLDLYVCNYVRYDDALLGPEQSVPTRSGAYAVPYTLNPSSFDPAPNRLYRNVDGARFADVAEAAGVADPEGRSLAAAMIDLDGDGWLDLYVNNDVSETKLFRSRLGRPSSPGIAAFADLSAPSGTADPRGSMGLSVSEIGWMTGAADGLPDLFLTHWVAQENALYQSRGAGSFGVEYRDKARQLSLAEISIDSVGWGSAFVDFDLDGRIDLAVANGSTLERKDDPRPLVPEPLFLFWNDGRRFHDLAPQAGSATERPYSARGLAACDFDRDGDVDLAVSVNRGRPLLLRNETPTANRSLAVALAGPSAACFGARIELVSAGRTQVQWWGADVSFLSAHGPELVFGLGQSAQAEGLSVRWADGTESRLEHVAAGRALVRHPCAGSPDEAR